MQRTELLVKGLSFLSVTVAMESRDVSLRGYCVCVSWTRNQYSWFHRLFYSQGSFEPKCLSFLCNDTSQHTITHNKWKTKRETNKLAAHFFVVFHLQIKIVWCRFYLFYSLQKVEVKCITAQTQAILLPPQRKHYILSWFVLFLIFLSTYRDMDLSLGISSSNASPLMKDILSDMQERLSRSQSCFSITLAGKQKQENISLPKFISALLFIMTTTNLLHECDYNSCFTQHSTDTFWTEMKMKSLGDLKIKIKPLLCWLSICSNYCIEEHATKKE